jgi:polyhydroxybutyrate depolymerase
MTGTADPLNPIGGGEIRIGQRAFGRKPPTHEMIGKWVKMVRCPEKPHVVYDKDGARGVAYGFPGDTDSVVLYTIAGHGHHWPGGKSALPESLAGKNTAKLKATDVIWEFFKRHPVPGQKSEPAEAALRVSAAPTPQKTDSGKPLSGVLLKP